MARIRNAEMDPILDSLDLARERNSYPRGKKLNPRISKELAERAMLATPRTPLINNTGFGYAAILPEGMMVVFHPEDKDKKIVLLDSPIEEIGVAVLKGQKLETKQFVLQRDKHRGGLRLADFDLAVSIYLLQSLGGIDLAVVSHYGLVRLLNEHFESQQKLRMPDLAKQVLAIINKLHT